MAFKFRRQHPIGQYIADFYCHRTKIIIEVDGSIHTLVEINKDDKIRQFKLENRGYNVIRFSNEQVLKQIETVLESIIETIKEIIIIQKLNASPKEGV